MKELSIEEKAKRYDEAIEKFDVILNLNTVKESKTIFADDVRKILTELKESEDERIRKALVELVYDTAGDSLLVDYDVHKEDAITWLEREGEHANFRNAIQVGDKVTRNEDGVLINLSQLNRVAKKQELEKQDGQDMGISEATKQKLENSLNKALEKETPESCNKFLDEQKSIQEIESFKAEHGKYYYCIKDYFCGGKKQASKGDVIQALRGLAIMGLKDASEYFLPVNFIKCNSAWSEEDEKMIGGLNNCLDELEKEHGWNYVYINDKSVELGKIRNWLKFFKHRYAWKPSDEQIGVIEAVINNRSFQRRHLDSLYEQLKKLREE